MLALASAAAAALVAPGLARRLPPATATVLLTGCAVAVTVATGYALSMLAFVWVAQVPEVAEQGDWSPLLLRHANPVPAVVALGSGLALAAGAVLAAGAAVRRLRAYRRMRVALAGLPHTDGLVVTAARRPDVYATPVAGGRIVLSQGLLTALRSEEIRAVLAHERSHLRRRHSWWAIAVDLCAAANPLLRPVSTAVAGAMERWADEDAAAAVGDRKLVARALARAALHVHQAADPAAALAVVGSQVPGRVRAMLEPPPRRRLLPAATLLAVLLTVTVATAATEASTDQVFDHAAVATADRD